MNKNKKLIVACAIAGATLFGAGMAMQNPVSANAAENEKAILYYDFSADTIGANVDGFSSVKNLGTKENANATIYNGTGLSVNDKLVFNQPQDGSAEKGFFELPTASFDGLTAFTVQMEVNGNDGGGDREPIFAMTQSSLTATTYGDSNQGILFGDGWTNSDGTYMESWIGGWGFTTTDARPFVDGIDYMLTMVYDGANLSFYYNNNLLIQKAQADTSFFGGLDYFRIGGRMMPTMGALNATVDNVKVYDYARSAQQILRDAGKMYTDKVSEAGAAPLVYYDFESAAAANGTVKNLGTGLSTGSSDGKIVQTKGDVYIEDGKLVIDNPTSNLTDKTNGYFLLPTYLFYQLNYWTIEMTVDHLDLQGDKAASFLSFSRSDPTVTAVGTDNGTQQIFWLWNNDKQIMAPYYEGRYASMWTVGTSNVANRYVDEAKTIAIVFNGGTLSFVYNNETVWTSPNVHGTKNYFTYFLFNKIGGYVQDYRAAADLKIDSFAFYDYARTNDQIAGANGQVENVVANLDDKAEAVTSYTAYDRFGNAVEANVTFPETIDFAKIGTKTYYVTVAGQAVPARFTLNTTAHEHADGNNDNACDGCGEIIDGIGKAYGINIGLNGTISANIFMELTDATIADEGAYMHTEYNGKVFEIPVKDAEVREGYYVFSVEVPAKEMDSTITSYMVRANGDKGVTYTYSIKEYAEKMMVEDPKTEALLKQLLNYGAYAKAFFAGEAVEATAEMNAVTKETLAAFASKTAGTMPAGIELIGASLILEAETTIRVYFKADAIENYTFTVAGQEVTAIAANGYYYLEITDISAKDLDTAYDFVISNGTDAFTLTYSALSYAYTTTQAANAEIVKVAQAMYLYNQAANAYFAN